MKVFKLVDIDGGCGLAVVAAHTKQQARETVSATKVADLTFAHTVMNGVYRLEEVAGLHYEGDKPVVLALAAFQ